MDAPHAARFLEAGDHLIPHRPPMALVQGLERARGDRALVRALVPGDSLFVREDGTVEPLVLLEVIAQACAAFGGFKAAGGAAASGPDGESRMDARGAASDQKADGSSNCEPHGSPAGTGRAGADGDSYPPDASRANAPKAAFLVGVRSFEVEGPALAGEPVLVDVTLVREFGGFHLFEGEASQRGRRVARASLKAYHPGPGRDMPST